MTQRSVQQLRSSALIVATVLLGISWSFALLHIRTSIYPALWSAATPFLAFWYASGSRRVGLWKYLPAAAISLYAAVLWQIAHTYGIAGTLGAAAGIIAGVAALWLGSRLSPRRFEQLPQARPAGPAIAPTALGSGVARRRRLRAQAARR